MAPGRHLAVPLDVLMQRAPARHVERLDAAADAEHGHPARVGELGERELVDARGMPVLGICRGVQTLNVARGGTLHQHIEGHRQTAPGRVTTHSVKVEPGSRLAEVLGVTEAEVNSFHHQAAARLGEGLRAVAWAEDGLVEGLEDSGEQLYLGVQWHVESLVDRPEHLRLFEVLVEEALAFGQGRERRAA